MTDEHRTVHLTPDGCVLGGDAVVELRRMARAMTEAAEQLARATRPYREKWPEQRTTREILEQLGPPPDLSVVLGHEPEAQRDPRPRRERRRRTRKKRPRSAWQRQRDGLEKVEARQRRRSRARTRSVRLTW